MGTSLRRGTPLIILVTMFKNIITLFFGLMFCAYSIAQTGTIRGTVIDDENGEPIMFATVFVPETSGGTTTDLDGAFSLSLAPGTYSIEISYVGYSNFKINEIVVSENKITPLSIRLAVETEVLKEVVVEAKQLRNTEAALATIKRKSVNVIDGVSSASFSRTSDGDAAAAVKRVPGVSVQGGKYVFVRGLGDRYTKSTLNGMDIPGLDPDRNTVQMDIFPTNVLDNIIVVKSFTADLPADFTGGIVNITTKDFPDTKRMSVSAGMGFNPDMHFNDQYLTYDGGGTDFLGFDDGTRDNPTGGSTDIPTYAGDALSNPNGARAQEYIDILNGFNPTLAAKRQNSFADFSLGFNFGNQINREKNTLGYNFSLAYKNSTRFYENVVYSRYGKSNNLSEFEMERREYQEGDLGENNVLIGALAGFSIKSKASKYSVNLLHLQNGESKAGIFDYVGADQGSNFRANQHNLEYSQRQLTNLLINGTHSLKEDKWNLEWKLAPTLSIIEDPDIRFTRYRTDDGRISIGTESGIPERIWRDLMELNYAAKVDLTRDYSLKQRDAKLKFGVANTIKDRSYEIQSFQIYPNSIDLTGDPNEIFEEQNLWNAENRGGTYFTDLFLPKNPNKYDASSINTGAYVSTEIEPFKRLKSIVGVRVENFQQNYTGLNQSGQLFDKEKVLDDLDIFPSLNLIYALNENQNLRFSATKTIARPSFKEASFATILDPITGRTFIGGFFPDVDVQTGELLWDGNLKSTDITNLDLRWETYGSSGQTIGISAFYKYFVDPIEIVQYIQAANNFQPRNVGDGTVMGMEFEARQNLGNLIGGLSHFNIVTNVTLTYSEIEMSASEYTTRVNNARDGESIERTRDMAGQSPYLINAGLAYQNRDRFLDAGLYYNVQGPTLLYVGVTDRPDIYSVPFHNLKFTASKKFGKEHRYAISFEASNLLGDLKEEEFNSFNAEDQIFTRLDPGISFSLGLKYSIF